MLRQLLVCSTAILLAAAGCQSINIKTGPPTDEELTAQSADRGRQIRTEWSYRLGNGTPEEQLELLKTFVDSTTARYLRYGWQVADTWRDESDRHGSEIPAAEIRKAIDASTQVDYPLFEAYEDVLDFGIEGIQEARFFEPRTEELLLQYRDYYLEVYEGVFLPDGTRDDYENRLRELETRSRELSDEMEKEISRF